jgi:HAD superfamily hydrolase (TIGR01484 family)
MAIPAIIQLAAVDIDGCLNSGVHNPYDLDILGRLRNYNQRARKSDIYPAITLCTGRPAPYVQAVIQMLDLHSPTLCEHGNMMTGIDESRVAMHPQLDPSIAQVLLKLRDLLLHRLSADPPHFETGKETHLTIFPGSKTPVEKAVEAASAIIREQGWHLEARLYGSCAVATQPDMHKGVGMRWLAHRMGISLENIAGIGDSKPDADFLKLVGYSGAVANAVPDIKNLPVDFVAKAPDIAGVLEFYESCIERNRRIIPDSADAA